MADLLYEDHATELDKAAKNKKFFFLVASHGPKNTWHTLGKNHTCYLNTNASANEILNRLTLLCKYCGVTTSDIKITLAPDPFPYSAKKPSEFTNKHLAGFTFDGGPGISTLTNAKCIAWRQMLIAIVKHVAAKNPKAIYEWKCRIIKKAPEKDCEPIDTTLGTVYLYTNLAAKTVLQKLKVIIKDRLGLSIDALKFNAI